MFRYLGNYPLIPIFPITKLVLNIVISCLDFCNNLLTGLLTFFMPLSPVCSLRRGRNIFFFKLKFWKCHSPLLQTIQYLLIDFNMNFEYLLNLTPSIFPSSRLNYPQISRMLSLPQFHSHCDFFHYWAFIHAITSFWIFFHPSHLNFDSLPQRSLSDSPV